MGESFFTSFQPSVDESPFFTKPPTPPVTPDRASRDETYRQRALIAEYQAKSEPHSPRPYPINRAVKWGAEATTRPAGQTDNRRPRIEAAMDLASRITRARGRSGGER